MDKNLDKITKERVFLRPSLVFFLFKVGNEFMSIKLTLLQQCLSNL
jgi:hypothetical protein